VFAVHSVSPELVLKPPHHLTSIDFNWKDESVLGAGMQNGQLAFFDTRRGAAPVELSSLWTSHRDPVCRMLWITSKSGLDCMSTATDGQVRYYTHTHTHTHTHTRARARARLTALCPGLPG